MISRTEAAQHFVSVKDSIRQQSSNPEKVKQDGDRYEVVDSFQVSSPSGDYTVRKGSFFDNDLKTRDKVAVDMAPTADGTRESRSYEHYSKKNLLIFTDERLKFDNAITQSGPNGHFSSSNSADFSI